MKTINIYSFEELSEEAKVIALKNEREKENYYDLYFFQEDCRELISEAGFKGNIKVSYSLSYSQGDGLSFSCDYYENMNDIFIGILGAHKQKTIDCIINNLEFNANGNNGRYAYCSIKDIELEIAMYSNIEKVVETALNKIQDIYVELCEKLEKNGYDEIEYKDSDEYLIEGMNENQYTENGYEIR